MENNKSHQGETDGADDGCDDRDGHHAAGHLCLSSSPCQKKTDLTAKFPQQVVLVLVGEGGIRGGTFSPRSRRILMGIELTVAMSLTVVPRLSPPLCRRRRLLLVPVLQFCRGIGINSPSSPTA